MDGQQQEGDVESISKLMSLKPRAVLCCCGRKLAHSVHRTRPVALQFLRGTTGCGLRKDHSARDRQYFVSGSRFPQATTCGVCVLRLPAQSRIVAPMVEARLTRSHASQAGKLLGRGCPERTQSSKFWQIDDQCNALLFLPLQRHELFSILTDTSFGPAA